MPFKPDKKLKFAESDIPMAIGEGLYPTLDVTEWTTGTVASATISIEYDKDESDVTSSWTTTATCTVADQIVTFPKMTVPALAKPGKYKLTVTFSVTGGPYEPGKPWNWIVISE